MVLLDQRSGMPPEGLSELTVKILTRRPDLAVFHLLNNTDSRPAWEAIRSGARSALPKPDLTRSRDTFVADCIFLLDTLRKGLKIAPAAGTFL